MVFSGVGAGINELTALAAVSEMAPTRQRGTYVAVLIFTIVPFVPSVLYGQLIAYYTSWRWIALICGLWAAFGTVFTAIFYFPPPRVNSSGLTRAQVMKEVDWLGGLLSISGMLLFMMGLQWGGYQVFLASFVKRQPDTDAKQYPWGSAHVLVPLILGVVLVVAFFVWEAKFAKFPMFPKRLQQDPRVLALTLLITFISGANFFSVLMFWPTQAFNVYGHDPVGVGLRGLPIGVAIMAGACIVLVLLSVLKGQIRLLMVCSTIVMTAGTGAMAVAEVNNMGTLWFILVLAGLGIGGILVPASIITTIICPGKPFDMPVLPPASRISRLTLRALDDLIATVAAITLSVRVIGGSIGYCTYYNVFLNKFIPVATTYIGGTMYKYGIQDPVLIGEVIELTGASLIEEIAHIPQIAAIPGAYESIVVAGQLAYAAAYKWVYYISIAFGGVSIIAAAFLGDISKYMDDHVAVVVE